MICGKLTIAFFFADHADKKSYTIKTIFIDKIGKNLFNAV